MLTRFVASRGPHSGWALCSAASLTASCFTKYCMLSAIRGDDIRFQILMDGCFHLLMYVIAALGLWALWRMRAAFNEDGPSRRFWGWLRGGIALGYIA